ncbi:MAG: hypothetical protein ABIY55_26215 [Kofleriaceae bacterium]
MKAQAQMVRWSGILLTFAGCSSSAAALDANMPPHGDATVSDGIVTDALERDAPAHVPGTPGLGAHAIKFYHLDASDAPSITASLKATQASGSTIVVSVGRGDNTLFAIPTDNKLNAPYGQLGEMHPYGFKYRDSGTAVYAFTAAKGGDDFQVSTATGKTRNSQNDEITIAAVEVIEGTKIQAFEWNEVEAPPLTSKSVTTTGPATLVAFWWGDGYPDTTSQTASPDNGFQVVENNVDELHAFVQCSVAVKSVTAPGTYNVTWSATPTQGAQLWLVAVQ